MKRTTTARSRNVIVSVGVNVTLSAISSIIGLIVTGFLARTLQIAEFGRILIIITTVTAFAIFEGTRSVVIQRIASGNYNFSQLYHEVKIINAVMAMVVTAIIFTCYLFGIIKTIDLASACILSTTAAAFFISVQYSTFLDAEEDTAFTGAVKSFGLITLYVSFAGLALISAPLIAYTFALLLMYIMMIAALALRFKLGRVREKHTNATPMNMPNSLMKQAIHNIVFNICAVTINFADRFVISATLGDKAAGLYAGPSELIIRASGLMRSAIQVLLPWAAKLEETHQSRYWSIGIATIILLVGTVCVVLLLERNLFITLYLGQRFLTSADIFGIFTLSLLTISIGYICILKLNATGNFTTQRRLYQMGAAIVICGSILGTARGNLNVVAWSFFIGRCVDIVIFLKITCTLGREEQICLLAICATVASALICGWFYLAVPATVSILVASALYFKYVSWARGQ